MYPRETPGYLSPLYSKAKGPDRVRKKLKFQEKDNPPLNEACILRSWPIVSGGMILSSLTANRDCLTRVPANSSPDGLDGIRATSGL